MTQTEKEFLNNYDKNKYEKPSVTPDIVVLSTDDAVTALRVLLVQRKKHPFKDFWAIPGGFLDIHESLEDGARRELKEETNIDAPYLKQVGAFGEVERDPRMRIISVAYVSLIERKLLNLVQAGDDAKKAEWFFIRNSRGTGLYLEHEMSHERIEMDQLAFDHKNILIKALETVNQEMQQNHETAFYLTGNHSVVERVTQLFMSYKI